MDASAWIALVAIPAAGIFGTAAALIGVYALNRNRKEEERFEVARGLGRVEGRGRERGRDPDDAGSSFSERFGFLRSEVATLTRSVDDQRTENRANRGLIEQVDQAVRANHQESQRAHQKLSDQIEALLKEMAEMRKHVARLATRQRLKGRP